MIFNQAYGLSLSPYIEIKGRFGWGMLWDLGCKQWCFRAPRWFKKYQTWGMEFFHFYMEFDSFPRRICKEPWTGQQQAEGNQWQQGQYGSISSKDFHSMGFSEDKWKEKSRHFQIHVTYPQVLPEITGVNLIGVLMCYRHVHRGHKQAKLGNYVNMTLLILKLGMGSLGIFSFLSKCKYI